MICASSSSVPRCIDKINANDAVLRELVPLPVMQVFVDHAAQHRPSIPVKHLRVFDYLVAFCQGCNAHEAAVDWHVSTFVAIKNIRRLGLLGVDATIALLKRGEHKNADAENTLVHQGSYRPPSVTFNWAEYLGPSPSPPQCPPVPSDVALPMPSAPTCVEVLLSQAQTDANFARTYLNPNELEFDPDWFAWPPQAQTPNLEDACTTAGSEASIASYRSPRAQNLTMTLAPSPAPSACTPWSKFDATDISTHSLVRSLSVGEGATAVHTAQPMAAIHAAQMRPTQNKRSKQKSSRNSALLQLPFVEQTRFDAALWPEPAKTTHGHRATREQRAYFAAYARAHAPFVPPQAQAQMDALVAICEGANQIATGTSYGLVRATLAARLRRLSQIGPKALFHFVIMQACKTER